jgi:hypothetical protein
MATHPRVISEFEYGRKTQGKRARRVARVDEFPLPTYTVSNPEADAMELKSERWRPLEGWLILQASAALTVFTVWLCWQWLH